MMELATIVQCWAALAAFRAAVPERFADETGLQPGDFGVGADRWRLLCRAAGSLLLVGASALAINGAGVFEGIVLAAAAAMTACVGVILLTPLARRLVWGTAAVCLAFTPVAVVLALSFGGSHGAG